MKTFRSTLIFFVIVVGIAGFAIWEYQKSQSEEATEGQENLVFKIDIEDVKILRMVRPENTLVLEREGSNGWKMTEPVEARADVAAVDGLVARLLAQKGTEIEPKFEGSPDEQGVKSVDWAQYGLEKPATRIEISSSEGGKTELSVSELSAFDGSFFLRKGDELMVGDREWAQLVNHKANELRDKSVLSGASPKTEIILDKGKTSQQLINKDGKWQLADKPEWNLDQSRVNGWLEELKNLKAVEFAAEVKDSATRKDFNLAKPAAVIRWSQGEGNSTSEQVVVEVSEPKDNGAYVVTSQSDTIFKIARAKAEALARDFSDLRDKKEPFRFDLEQANAVSVRTPDVTVQVNKSGSDWTLANPPEGKQLDDQKLQSLFSKLSQLETKEFLTSVSEKKAGLNPARRQLLIQDAKGEPLLELVWGDEYKEKGSGSPLYYVKTNHSKDVLGVQKMAINDLPFNSLVKDKEKPTQENGK